MKAIIAGGRNFIETPNHVRWLRKTLRDLNITEVITGDAPGADLFGYKIAVEMGISIKHFPASWTIFGKSAGPRRNKEMADYAGEGNYCILFPGGKGTMNMRLVAEANGLIIIDYKE